MPATGAHPAPRESDSPASSQQITPALTPAMTAPRPRASRMASPTPCSSQTASVFAVLPPVA